MGAATSILSLYPEAVRLDRSCPSAASKRQHFAITAWGRRCPPGPSAAGRSVGSQPFADKRDLLGAGGIRQRTVQSG
jgi:hypothetical protein